MGGSDLTLVLDGSQESDRMFEVMYVEGGTNSIICVYCLFLPLKYIKIIFLWLPQLMIPISTFLLGITGIQGVCPHKLKKIKDILL